MKHWKVLPTTIVGRQAMFCNSRHSRMVKMVTFWPCWQSFNNFYLKNFSFFSCLFPCYSKELGNLCTTQSPTCTTYQKCLLESILAVLTQKLGVISLKRNTNAQQLFRLIWHGSSTISAWGFLFCFRL